MSSESRPEREPEQRREPEAEPAETGSATAESAEAGSATAESAEAGSATAESAEAGSAEAKAAADESAPAPGAASGTAAGGEPEGPVYADRCYRSPAALAGGVMLLLLAAWLGTDALLHGVSRTRVIALSGLLCAVPLVVAFTLRPAVYANAQRMRVRNPFRTITVPWGTVESLQSGYSSEVVADGTKYQLWSIPVSLRARKRAARQVERAERAASKGSAPARPTGLFGLGGVSGGNDDAMSKRAPSDQAIDELRALALENGERGAAQGEVTVRWAYEIAVPALAGGIALAVLLGVF
ncbi:PH domain-containing protein [Streptomyces sp. WMMB 714]|uniref:PH domain-containing protein n=1 Tax=Streptomyces sp. WMMB 714 TaxID=1286822 RepID=UPI000823D10E|nr:PH domain-containing protein [Streptomyces sp. WMMB 714]